MGGAKSISMLMQLGCFKRSVVLLLYTQNQSRCWIGNSFIMSEPVYGVRSCYGSVYVTSGAVPRLLGCSTVVRLSNSIKDQPDEESELNGFVCVCVRDCSKTGK